MFYKCLFRSSVSKNGKLLPSYSRLFFSIFSLLFRNYFFYEIFFILRSFSCLLVYVGSFLFITLSPLFSFSVSISISVSFLLIIAIILIASFTFSIIPIVSSLATLLSISVVVIPFAVVLIWLSISSFLFFEISFVNYYFCFVSRFKLLFRKIRNGHLLANLL